jgi:hypothetical protein
MKRLFGTHIRLLGLISTIVLVGFLQTTAGQACGVYCHSEFRKYFDGLGAAEARVNPVERVLFSVLLATTNPNKVEHETARLPRIPAKHL